MTKAEWHDPAQFFPLATQMMRRILVDAARIKSSQKRGENYPGGDGRLDADSEPVLVSLDERFDCIFAGCSPSGEGPWGRTTRVTELVEGETIAVRLKSGPLPRKTALLYASQIMDALVEEHGKVFCIVTLSRVTGKDIIVLAERNHPKLESGILGERRS